MLESMQAVHGRIQLVYSTEIWCLCTSHHNVVSGGLDTYKGSSPERTVSVHQHRANVAERKARASFCERHAYVKECTSN